MYLPDTNVCISFLRSRKPDLVARWRATKADDLLLCSIVVYELRYGAARSSNPIRENAKLDKFLAPYVSLAFDDACAYKCAQLRNALERNGKRIGPHDLQIAAVALSYELTLVTHNTHEFGRVEGLKLEDWES